MTPPSVELRGLGHAFGDRVVLRELSLAIEPGTAIGILGPNGSGKSTLLRCIAGLLRPLRGGALLDGVAAVEAPAALRRRIGYLGHRPLVWAGLSCRENLAFYASLYGVGDAGLDERLARVGLGDRGGDRVRDLSQGMRQRLGLARALLHDPDLWVLDEPHSALDAEGRSLLHALIGGTSATVVMATHDVAAARQLCSRTLTLANGRLAA